MVKHKIFTDDELGILRSIPKDLEYLARDKNGELCLYSDKPEKCSVYWCGFITEINIRIFNHLFKSICWEDEEPLFIDDYVTR